MVTILLINLVVGKYLYTNKSYISQLIKDMIYAKKSNDDIQYIHLRIHYDPYRNFIDLKYLTVLECIHYINDELEKRISCDERKLLINSYLFCLERGHTPLNVELIEDNPRMFENAGKQTLTKLDSICRNNWVIVPKK